MSDGLKKIKERVTPLGELFGESVTFALRFIEAEVLPTTVQNIKARFEALSSEEAETLLDGVLGLMKICENCSKSLLISHPNVVLPHLLNSSDVKVEPGALDDLKQLLNELNGEGHDD